MTPRGVTRLGGMLLGVTLLGAAVQAVEAQGMGASGTWAAVPAMESYRFSAPEQAGIRSIALMSFPVAGRVTLHPRATLEFTGAFAAGSVTLSDGTARTLSGFTDSNLQLQAAIIPDRVSVVLVASAPTGVATHDSAQAVVAGVVAADLLPFRVMSWGTGGGVGGQLLFTQRVGRTGVGFSTGVRRAGDFEPVAADRFTYRPGLETSARVALDQDLAGGGKLSLTAAVQSFGDDQVDGANLFRSGLRVSAIGTLGVPVRGGGSAAVYGGVLHRANGSFLDATLPESPSQDLLLVGGLLRRAMGRGTATPRADVRIFRSADGVGQGYVAGLGVGYERRGTAATFAPSLTARVGSVTVRQGAQSGIVGLDLGLSIRFTGRGR